MAISVPIVGTVANAQNGDEQTAPSGFVCMSRASQGPDGATHITRVMVPNGEEAKLAGRGFVLSSCGKAVKWMRTTGPSMCSLADLNDPTFVNQFLNTHGLTPAEICDLAGPLPG